MCHTEPAVLSWAEVPLNISSIRVFFCVCCFALLLGTCWSIRVLIMIMFLQKLQFQSTYSPAQCTIQFCHSPIHNVQHFLYHTSLLYLPPTFWWVDHPLNLHNHSHHIGVQGCLALSGIIYNKNSTQVVILHKLKTVEQRHLKQGLATSCHITQRSHLLKLTPLQNPLLQYIRLFACVFPMLALSVII